MIDGKHFAQHLGRGKLSRIGAAADHDSTGFKACDYSTGHGAGGNITSTVEFIIYKLFLLLQLTEETREVPV